jgi:thioredoxin 1
MSGILEILTAVERDNPMTHLKQFTDATFQSDVLDARGFVLVDFTAAWCGPCKMLAPIVQQIADEFQAQMTVGKLDIDENVETMMQYGIMGVPTLMLFKDGQPVERLSGYLPKDRIITKLSPHLS